MPQAALLAGARLASMVAPAGCGKTELIARAVAHHSPDRPLILTHTHAGVDALRARLQRLATPPTKYHLTTIAGWSLQLASHYPATSGVLNDAPVGPQWDETYPGAARVLRVAAIQDAVRASYSGVYVDEYQDCTEVQHDLVVALAGIVPCRVIGDPLQGVFDFRGRPLDWARHVSPVFPGIAGPTTPHRWSATNPELGAWLQAARAELVAGRSIELRGAPVTWVRPPSPEREHPTRVQACRNVRAPETETVTVVFGASWETLGVARSLGGQFSCIEPIESDDLSAFARDVDAREGPARAAAVLGFAVKCMVGVSAPMKSVAKALNEGREPLRVTTNPAQRDALIAIARDRSLAAVTTALERLKELSGAHTHRRELLSEACKSLQLAAKGDYATVLDAAKAVRNQTRLLGRRLPRRAIGTTLLVKGLEFDHAVVVNPASMNAKNLYVALTRGRRSLTVVSPTSTLVPADDARDGDAEPEV